MAERLLRGGGAGEARSDAPAAPADLAARTVDAPGGALGGAADPATIPDLDRWARLAGRLLGAPLALVPLLDTAGGEEGITAPGGDSGDGTGLAAGQALAADLCRRVAERGQTVADPDDAGGLFAAALAAPLRSVADPGRILGALCVLAGTPRRWSPEEAALLEDLAAGAAAELERARERARRVRAERALAAAAVATAPAAADQARLRLVLDNLDEAVTASLPNGGPAVRNAAWLRFHHAENAAAAPGGSLDEVEPHFALADPDGRPLARDEWPLRRALRGEAFRDLVLRVRRTDTGEAWWGSYNGSAARDHRGRVTLAVISMRDVTDRERAAAALRASEARAKARLDELEALYRASPIGLGVQDRDLRFVRLNEALARAFGATVDGLLGRTLAEAKPRVAALVEAPLRHVLATGEALMGREIADPLADGPDVRRDWLVDRYPVRDGGAVVGVATALRDVTAQRAAERTALAAAERLRLALAGAGMGAWRVDLATGAVTRDATMRALFGLPEAPAPVSDEDVYARVHPADRDAMRAASDLPAGRGEDFAAEFRVVLPDGGVRWLAGRGGLVRDAAGRAVELIGVNWDVSAPRRADVALRESRARLAVALEAGGLGVWETDLAAGVVRLDERARALFGREEEVLPVAQAFEIVHPEDRAGAVAAFEAAVAGGGGGYEVEHRVVRPDGSVRWIHARGRIAFEDLGVSGHRPVRVTGMVLDVTGRRLAEAERERLALIVEETPDLVATADADGRLLYLNRAGRALAGLGQDEEYRGRPLADFRPPAAPDPAVAADGDGVWSGEDVMRDAAGREFPVSRTVIPRRDPAGRLLHATTIARDITARKAAQAQNELLLRELEHRIRNLFALAGAIVSLCARRAATAQDLARAVQGRLAALARAQDVIRLRDGASSAGLEELARELLAPHHVPAEGRVRFAGPALRVGGNAAVSLSLVLHELATNAAKYGALSAPGGTLLLAWSLEEPPAAAEADGRLHLLWEERGGPPAAPPGHEGFGSLMIRESARGFGGAVVLDYGAAGLTARLEAPLSRLSAGAEPPARPLTAG